MGLNDILFVVFRGGRAKEEIQMAQEKIRAAGDRTELAGLAIANLHIQASRQRPMHNEMTHALAALATALIVHRRLP